MSASSNNRRGRGTRRRVPEPWEVERLHREFPVKSREELERTLANCKEQAGEDQEKGKLTRCVQRKLSK